MAGRYATAFDDTTARLTWRRGLALVAAVIVTLLVLVTLPKMVENVDASEVVLFQSPSGHLTWVTQPGLTCQCLSKVTRYQKAGKLTFAQIDDVDGRIRIGFNDGGTALIRGSMNFELPLDQASLTEIHSRYPDQSSLEAGLLQPALTKSVYLTGPIMSSRESYAERRSQMIQYVEDQVQNGVYLMRTRQVEEADMTAAPAADGSRPMIRRVISEIQTGPDGRPSRAEEGQLARFKIRAYNLAIEDMAYSDAVTTQIAQQQKITMAVETAIADAKRAVQDAITAKAQGDANIATTRAAEEVEKTKAVVQAEKARDVARLKADEAESYKKEQILRADADSEYKRRILQADGALQQKLATLEKIHALWSAALTNYKGPALVPTTVLGGGAGTGTGVNGVQQFMELLAAKAARDLQIDLTPSPRQ
jgi:hypothetical protein